MNFSNNGFKIFQIATPTAPGIVSVDRDELVDTYKILYDLDNSELDEVICDSFRSD